MKKRIAFCFVAAFVSIFGLAACGGGDEARQEPKEQQEPKERQEPKEQAAQTAPSTTQRGELATALIGRWEATSIQGNPAPPGTLVLAFSEDGTLRSTSTTGSPQFDFTARYEVLDDSRIELSSPDGPSYLNYTLNEDGALTTTNEGGVSVTYQRTG